jgi:hypothetical protein
MARETKEMVAVRLDPSARRKIKVLAERLKASESDILRYAIDVALEELSPLCDPVKEGVELLPAFLEHGAELMRALDLDIGKLDDILHGDLEDERNRVPREDMRMMLGGGQTPGYVEWFTKVASGELRAPLDQMSPEVYLRDKYPESSRMDDAWVAQDDLERRLEK